MQKRKLGNSDVLFAPIALGTNVFGWTIDEAKSFKLLDQFTEAGFSFLDTADVYSTWAPGNIGGESESIIGNWLKTRKNRDTVVIATKVGKPMGPDKKGLSAKYIRQAVEDSLKRLRTDYIDLYQSHDDDRLTPMEETLEAFAELIREGKVKAIGASNFTAGRLQHALDISEKYGLPRYESLQPLYNLMERKQFEDDLEPFCVKNNIGVLSYYSLASGFLTGKYRSEVDLSKSPRGAGTGKYLNEKGFGILKILDQLSVQYHASPAAIALAWLIARPSVTAPIASATTETQLESILQSARLSLAPESIHLLNSASAD